MAAGASVKPRKVIHVDAFSRLAVRLTMLRDEIDLASGSGFLWDLGDRKALITAWHCLTGTHPETRQPLSKETGARPNKVKLSLLMGDFGDGEITLDLYDQQGDPIWYVHRLGSREVDIAAVFFNAPLPEISATVCANAWDYTNFEVTVGADLFILGFPRNLHRMGLPIWKRASLAIVPDATLDEKGKRHLLVDTASRKGMSGALVIAQSNGSYRVREGLEFSTIYSNEQATKLIGVYSGREGSDDELAAQIGIVWPIELVHQLLKDPVPDDFA